MSQHSRHGYAVVTLHRDGLARTVDVAVLVLEAFVGQRPVGCQALHRDRDPGNAGLENLFWGTLAAKVALRRKSARKLDMWDADWARRKVGEGFTRRIVAKVLGVSESVVQHIVAGRTYRKKHGTVDQVY